jgi:hypothetical protein
MVSAQPDPGVPLRPNSLFEHLNQDIRIMIYDYIEPPIVSDEAAGLILSCRQAQNEYSDWAIIQSNRKLHRILTAAKRRLKRKTGFTIGVPDLEGRPGSFAAPIPKEVTISIPRGLLVETEDIFDIIDEQRFSHFVHLCLDPLLRLKLNKVTIKVGGNLEDLQGALIRDHAGLSPTGKLLYDITILRKDIEDLIYKRAMRYTGTFPGKLLWRPKSNVRTSGITISWAFAQPDSPVHMEAEEEDDDHDLETEAKLTIMPVLDYHHMKAEKGPETLQYTDNYKHVLRTTYELPDSYPWPSYTYSFGPEYLSGELLFYSPTRWKLWDREDRWALTERYTSTHINKESVQGLN